MADILPFRPVQARQTGTGLRDLVIYDCPIHGTFAYPYREPVVETRPCPHCQSEAPFSHFKREEAPYRR